MNLGYGVVALGCVLSACGAAHSTTGDGDDAGGLPGIGFGSNDPAPPPAQGAVTFSVSAVSPSPAGKMCPAGAALTSMIPNTPNPTEVLSAMTYLHHVIDGEDTAAVSCAVIGKVSTATFTFQGRISLGGRAFTLTDGVVEAGKGTASIALVDAQAWSGALTSPSSCAIEVAAQTAGNLQIKPGSMWAHFSCGSVEHAPSDACEAEGYFVLENCTQK